MAWARMGWARLAECGHVHARRRRHRHSAHASNAQYKRQMHIISLCVRFSFSPYLARESDMQSGRRALPAGRASNSWTSQESHITSNKRAGTQNIALCKRLSKVVCHKHPTMAVNCRAPATAAAAAAFALLTLLACPAAAQVQADGWSYGQVRTPGST